jgi:3'-5' exoribonuclease
MSVLSSPVGTQLTHEVLAVTQKIPGKTSRNDDMLTIELADSDGGRIRCKVWSDQVPAWAAVREGQAVTVSGRIEAGYKGGPPELKVTEIGATFDAHPALDGLLPTYDGDLGQLKKRFTDLVQSIESPAYRRFLHYFFREAAPMEKFAQASAGLSIHHAMVHGLLLHTCQVAENVRNLCVAPDFADRVNRDLAITTALIHDAGKLEEYSRGAGNFTVSTRGHLYTHVLSGALMVDRVFAAHRDELEALGMTEEHRDHLLHGVASHHGQLEWGANIVPSTLEAVMLHEADLASARVQATYEFISTGTPQLNGMIENRGRRHGFGVVVTPDAPPATATPRVRSSDPETMAPLAVGTIAAPAAATVSTSGLSV